MLKRFLCLITRLEARMFLSKCGRNLRIGHSAHLKGYRNIEIGNNFFSGPYLYLNTNSISSIKIGNDVMLGPYVKIISGNHVINFKRGPMNMAPIKKIGADKGITIEDDVWIGVSAIILDGAIISEGAVIGAGSVVTKFIPPYVVAAGNPVSLIRPRFRLEELAEVLEAKQSSKSIHEICELYRHAGLKI